MQGLFTLVLDEADRLFSRELRDSTGELIEACIRASALPSPVQLIGSSATINEKTEAAFSRFAKEYAIIRIEKNDVLKHNIDHQALYAEDREKIDCLRRYIAAVSPAKAIIFSARLDMVEKIYFALEAKKIKCIAIHAKTGKLMRKGAMDTFRSGKANVLVTSDLSARGLDIPGITHIIQMDMPDGEAFIHRAGRTARAGKRGINMVIGNRWELSQYAQLEKTLGIVVYPKALEQGKLLAADDAQQ
jgi:superfamily II DNA/RNA helicase